MNKVFVQHGLTQYGPLSLEEALTHLQHGRFHQSDLARHAGHVNWQPLAHILQGTLPTDPLPPGWWSPVSPDEPPQPALVAAGPDPVEQPSSASGAREAAPIGAKAVQPLNAGRLIGMNFVVPGLGFLVGGYVLNGLLHLVGIAGGAAAIYFLAPRRDFYLGLAAVHVLIAVVGTTRLVEAHNKKAAAS